MQLIIQLRDYKPPLNDNNNHQNNDNDPERDISAKDIHLTNCSRGSIQYLVTGHECVVLTVRPYKVKRVACNGRIGANRILPSKASPPFE